MKSSDLTAVILAGGKNSRLKREKSLLILNKKPLVSQIDDILTRIFTKIMVVSSKSELKEKYSHLIFVEDEYFNCGPLAGIQTALKQSSTEYMFVCACDMPNLNPGIIQKLISVIGTSEADVIVPRHAEGIEPLHAIYKRSCLPYIEKQLEAEICSIRSFYDQVTVEFVDFQADEIEFFYNINTLHDLNRYLISQ
jgi:molybdenum cofactor guanylyltransferase